MFKGTFYFIMYYGPSNMCGMQLHPVHRVPLAACPPVRFSKETGRVRCAGCHWRLVRQCVCRRSANTESLHKPNVWQIVLTQCGPPLQRWGTRRSTITPAITVITKGKKGTFYFIMGRRICVACSYTLYARHQCSKTSSDHIFRLKSRIPR